MLSRAALGVVQWKDKSQQTKVAAREIPIQYQAKKKFTVRVVKYGSGEVGGGNNRSCGLSVLNQSHLCNPTVLKQLTLTLPEKLKVAPKLALLWARA